MAAVSVHIAGLERISAKLRPALVLGPVKRLVRDASDIAQREARSGARGLGGIPSSIQAETRDLVATIGSSHPGALVMEFGRHPGTTQPPVAALSRYGNAAFAIARSIGRRGIKGRFFLRHARNTLRSRELPRLTDRAAREIADEWRRP